MACLEQEHSLIRCRVVGGSSSQAAVVALSQLEWERLLMLVVLPFFVYSWQLRSLCTGQRAAADGSLHSQLEHVTARSSFLQHPSCVVVVARGGACKRQGELLSQCIRPSVDGKVDHKAVAEVLGSSRQHQHLSSRVDRQADRQVEWRWVGPAGKRRLQLSFLTFGQLLRVEEGGGWAKDRRWSKQVGWLACLAWLLLACWLAWLLVGLQACVAAHTHPPPLCCRPRTRCTRCPCSCTSCWPMPGGVSQVGVSRLPAGSSPALPALHCCPAGQAVAGCHHLPGCQHPAQGLPNPPCCRSHGIPL